ncbi:MAG: MFS transporter [Chromatiales bacterium]|nr:MFS transporter [Chromatiales bacterium]
MIKTYQHGIASNNVQFVHLLLQVFFVGLAWGVMRTVVPVLAETEFGMPEDAFTLLSSFVITFGCVKGTLNFVAGRLSEKLGRRYILIAGWLTAIPVPWMIFYAPNWNWIIVSAILLGINQGLCWSMTQTAKIDIAHLNERGLAIGLNEFAGYLGVAASGVIIGYMSEILPPREALLLFGIVVILAALLFAWICVQETLPWMHAEARNRQQQNNIQQYSYRVHSIPNTPTTWQVFAWVSWHDRRMAAFSQAGLVEKFVDTLIWVFYPVYLYEKGVSLFHIGIIVGIYGAVWGVLQTLTGKLSDHIGRMKPIVLGMWICAIGIAIKLYSDDVLWWCISSAITGAGMALLYPNLSAAVSDISHPNWRGSAIGVYRFWRDLGYGVGALILGLTADIHGEITGSFGIVIIAMFLSGLLVCYWGQETLPKLRKSLPGR